MEIREIHFGRDERGLIDLALEVWAREDPYRSAQEPEAMVTSELQRSLNTVDLGAVAVKDERVCAMALVEPESAAGVPALTWLSVRPVLRRQGVATALLALVVDVLSACRVDELASATSAANRASLYWHLSRGFELAGSRVA